MRAVELPVAERIADVLEKLAVAIAPTELRVGGTGAAHVDDDAVFRSTELGSTPGHAATGHVDGERFGIAREDMPPGIERMCHEC